MKTSTVELNGKRYDAVTGKLLGSTPAQTTRPKNMSVEGFMKPAIDVMPPPSGIRRSTPIVGQHAVGHAAPRRTKVSDVSRTTPHNLAAHQPQHAKTLMRKAVQHPNTSFKRQAKTVSHTGALVKNPEITVIPKRAATVVDARRQQHARHARPSELVHHFNTPASTPQAASPSHATLRSKPITHNAAQPVRGQRTMAAALTPRPKQSSVDIFERALAQATSHKQPPHSIKTRTKKSRRLRTVLSISGFSFAILLIVSFFVYQNAMGIQLRLASSRAGIHATLPAWQPAGFSMDSLATAPGSITVHFNNATTSRSFSVAQTATRWDSGALLSDYVLPNTDASYQTIQSGGTTIYTYGNNNATWVTHGIWYRLTTDGALSTTQIVQLVASM